MLKYDKGLSKQKWIFSRWAFHDLYEDRINRLMNEHPAKVEGNAVAAADYHKMVVKLKEVSPRVLFKNYHEVHQDSNKSFTYLRSDRSAFWFLSFELPIFSLQKSSFNDFINDLQ